MKKIAIIPARAGSKGLKDKNIIDLNGKPLIAWTICAALDSGIFDKVIVSTDSVEYKEISEAYGAEVILREEELATDSASTFDVLNNLLNYKIQEKYDYFALLQPTSPLRNFRHIKEACSFFEDNFNKFDFLVSVCEAEYNCDLVKPIDDDNSLKHFDSDFSSYKRQDKKCYSPNGAIFLAKKEEYLKRKHFFGKKSLAYFMDRKDSVDIDTRIDLELVKIILSDIEENYNV